MWLKRLLLIFFMLVPIQLLWLAGNPCEEQTMEDSILIYYTQNFRLMYIYRYLPQTLSLRSTASRYIGSKVNNTIIAGR